MSDVVIRIAGLGKRYRLGVLGHSTIYHGFQSWWAKFRGQEDPNTIITETDSGSLKNKEFWALQDISYDVKQGDILGIIGRNGAGKSTLLKILSRVTSPTVGNVKIKGRIASLLEVGTGFHRELTGRENVYLNGAILGMTKKEIDRKFDEIVDFAEIEKFIDTPVKRYSSGMYVRLAFAVAAHLDPEILIVDEVLAVGDLNFRKKCLGKMKDISTSSGRTILFVSHDMSAIQSICNKGLLLSQGSLIYSGSAPETIKEYINQSDKGKNELVWTSRKKYPFSEVLQLLSFCIVDEKGEIPKGSLYNSKSYNAIVEAELINHDSRLIVAIVFYDSNRTKLFMTDVHDTGEFDFSKLRPGRMKFSVPIPVDMLWNGIYEIELICALHHTGWILPPENETNLKFEFYRDVDLNPYLNETRLGSLAPVLKWTINHS